MSEHITHVAIYDDTVRLVSHSKEFHEAFRISLQNRLDAGMMSSGARANHLHAIPFLEQTRDVWNQRKDGDGTEEKIAAALAWLAHRAIDFQVKAIQFEYDDIQDPRFSKDENDIYQDIVTFEKVFGGGTKKPLSPNMYISESTLARSMNTHPASKLVHVDPVESLFCSLVQQNLNGYHTFHKTAKNLDSWLQEFPNHYQKISENLETYIEAYNDPDPKKMEKYITGMNFYNEKDELIQLVRELQETGKSAIPLQDALDKAKDQSHYSQGLLRSYQWIKAANDFFTKKISKDAVYDTLEIYPAAHRI